MSKGTLDISLPIITLKGPNGRRIVLLTMMHVAPQEFYARCKKIIDEHDGPILFEGIKMPSEEDVIEITPAQSIILRSLRNLRASYTLIANILGWATQAEEVPPQSDWIHADIDILTLLAMWENEAIPLIQPPSTTNPVDLETDPQQAALIKSFFQGFMLAVLLRMKLGSSPVPPKLERVLLHRRNAVVIQRIDNLPTNSNILVIYGYAHAHGLIKALTRRRYKEITRDEQSVIAVDQAVARTARIISPLIGLGMIVFNLYLKRISRRIKKEGYEAVYGISDTN